MTSRGGPDQYLVRMRPDTWNVWAYSGTSPPSQTFAPGGHPICETRIMLDTSSDRWYDEWLATCTGSRPRPRAVHRLPSECGHDLVELRHAHLREPAIL